MARFKPARGKARQTATPRPGLPCLILFLILMAMTMALMFYALKSSGS
jgi:hypothetical protein